MNIYYEQKSEIETVLQTLKIIPIVKLLLLITILLISNALQPVYAEVIDRIQINQRGNQAEIKIRFVNRIQFVRQVMLKKGDVRIYFNLLEKDTADQRQTRQKRESPPSNIVEHFSITYPEIDSSLTISFGKPVEYQVRPGSDGRSISFFTPIVKKKAKSQQLFSSEPVSAQTEQDAKKLMGKAKRALQKKTYRTATALLKKILSMPKNEQSQLAHYLIGQVYEINGELLNASEAYLLYTKLYPNARNLKKVQERLARVVMANYNADKSIPEGQEIDDEMSFFGGFSQYYSKGLLYVDSTDIPTSVVTKTNTNNQSHLLSSLELTGRKRSESTETRLVFRDTFTASLIDTVGSRNFLQAAYFERGPIDQQYIYGLGRQTGAAGGLPSRFDGAWLNRKLGSRWRLNGSVGSPVAASGSNEETKVFAATSVDFNSTGGVWNGNSYFIGQRVAGIIDRRAAGIEAHYFKAGSNHMALLEYDTLFKEINVGLIQGNWITANGANYTLLLDQHRNLAITNALLLNTPPQSVSDLLQSGETSISIRDMALSASPIINVLAIGTTQPFSKGVKIGGDFKASNTTSFQAYDPDPLVLANRTFPRAWAYTYSAQIIGTDLLFSNNLGIASVSYTNASTFNARSLTFNQIATFKSDWQLNSSLQFYSSNDNLGFKISRINPSFRLSYQQSRTLGFEFSAGLVTVHSNSSTIDTLTQNKFFTLGYRWDF